MFNSDFSVTNALDNFDKYNPYTASPLDPTMETKSALEKKFEKAYNFEKKTETK